MLPAPAAAAPEEAAEEIEWVVSAPGAPAPAGLLVSLDPLVPVLVVDAPGLGVGEDFVGVGDFDEFGVGGFGAAGGREREGGQFGEEGLDEGGGKGGFTGSCPGGISCLGCGRLS